MQRDPTNKKKIFCDDALTKALKPPEPIIANMYQLNQLIQKQFKPTTKNAASVGTPTVVPAPPIPYPTSSTPPQASPVTTLLAAAAQFAPHHTSPPAPSPVLTPPPAAVPTMVQLAPTIAPIVPPVKEATPIPTPPKAPIVPTTPASKVFRIQPPSQPSPLSQPSPSATPTPSPSTPQHTHVQVTPPHNSNEASSIVLQALATGNGQLPPQNTHLLYGNVQTPFVQQLKTAMMPQPRPQISPQQPVVPRPATARVVQQQVAPRFTNNKTT